MEGGGIEPPDGVVIDPAQLPGGDHDAMNSDDEHEPDGGFDFNDYHDANGDHEPYDDFGFCDYVCALCDDGGDLLCCEGPCLRSFHPTREDGQYSGCGSLGFTIEQVEAMEHFFCMNCTNREHQCAGCGVLGSSGAANAQVFLCSHATCGRFYHPRVHQRRTSPRGSCRGRQMQRPGCRRPGVPVPATASPPSLRN